MKKIFAIISCILCIALLSFSAFADTPVAYTASYEVLIGDLNDTGDERFNDIFRPFTAAYGDPVKWISPQDSMIDIVATFTFTTHYDYIVLPRYTISYDYGSGNKDQSFRYEPYFAVTVSDWVLVDESAHMSYNAGSGVTVEYSFSLYKATKVQSSLPDGGLTIKMYAQETFTDITALDFPIYAPSAYISDPLPPDVSAPDSNQKNWDALNDRLDIVDATLTAIGSDITKLNSTAELVLSEVQKQRDYLENPTPDAVSQGEHIDSELSRVQDDVSGALAAMSIPDVNFEPSNFVLPDDSNVTKNFLNWFSNLYPLNIILPAGVGLWAVYLIIHGVRSS